MMENVLEAPAGASQHPSTEVDWWDRFVVARSADEFCKSWLALLCERIRGIRGAAVLVQSAEAGTFVPIAVWPAAGQELARLGGVVQRALSEKKAVLDPVPTGAQHGHHVAYPVQVGDNIVATVALDVPQHGEALRQVMRQLHWDSAWLAHLFAERERELATTGQQRFQSVLETISVALRYGKFQQALFEISNTLRQQMGCAHAAIGLVKDHRVRVAAMSDTAVLEKNAPLILAYRAAMEEALDAGRGVTYSSHADSDIPVSVASRAKSHAGLAQQSGATSVASYPVMLGAKCVGVITLAFDETRTLSEADEAWLDAFLALFGQIVEQRLAAERSSFGRLAHETKQVLGKLFGPRHLVWKVSTSLVLLTVALLVLIPVDYRVSAKTVIEGEVQRVAAAPFEGFIEASYVKAGNAVKRGQALAKLDDRELRIEQVKWASERDQYERKLREAMATHDLTATRVVSAQMNQADAQLKMVTEKIARAVLRAPYDGIVVSGDWSQQIGSPVETGKKLFEIAPLNSYRVILQVDEREIRQVRNGEHGRLLISGMASEPMDIDIINVTPVATTEDGKNFFRVEARLKHVSNRLRPGMEGVGKIDAGSRSLWWVLTHSFTDWLRMSIWSWTW